jgi:hypothetical protein
MQDRRFGRKIKLPSTFAIKHQLLTMMLDERLRRRRVLMQSLRQPADRALAVTTEDDCGALSEG